MICEKCKKQRVVLHSLCRNCYQVKEQKEEFIVENINKVLPFSIALNFCQNLNRYTDDCNEDDLFGYALYVKGDKGIVATKDYDLDENKWTIIMCNAKFHMSEGETGLKVKIHKDKE